MLNHEECPPLSWEDGDCCRYNPRVEIAESFYRYVRGEGQPPITLRDHYKTMCIVDAAYQSIYEGRPIKVDYN